MLLFSMQAGIFHRMIFTTMPERARFACGSAQGGWSCECNDRLTWICWNASIAEVVQRH